MAVSEQRRDDRLLPETRWASLVVFLILVPALIILWGLPGETADLWAWTIKPDLTPIFLGAAYGAGAYFFWRTFRAERWHPSSVGLFAAVVFAALMLVATLIDWDRFNHGDAPFLAAAAFYGWVGVYIVSPLALMTLWLRNRKTDPGQPDRFEAIVPTAVRRGARVFAVAALAAAGLFLLSPNTAIDVWPWQLTPLTARVLGCFVAEVGVAALMLSFDQRWSAWRLLVETFAVGVALLLVGALRAWSDFDHGDAMTWLYLGGLLGSAFGLLILYRRMEGRV